MLFFCISNQHRKIIMHIPYEGDWTTAGKHLLLNNFKNAMIFNNEDFENLGKQR